MKQVILATKVNTSYVDVTISNGECILKNIVYFNTTESIESLKKEIKFLFLQGFEIMHCGFFGEQALAANWERSISEMKFNIKVHPINTIDITKQLNKVTPDNLTTDLVCKYLNKTKNTVVKKNLPKNKKLKPVKYKSKSISINFLDNKNNVSENSRKEKTYLDNFSNYHTIIEETNIALIEELRAILEKTIPKCLTFCEKDFPDWLLKLLIKYPNQKSLRKARITNLSKLCGKKNTLAIKLVTSLRTEEEKEVNTKLSYITKSLSTKILSNIIDSKKISNYVKRGYQHPYLERLKELTGIDKFLAIYLIEEIGDIRRFSSADEMTKAFGVHVDEKTGLRSSANKVHYSSYKALINTISTKLSKTNTYFKQIYHQRIATLFSEFEATEYIEYKTTRIIYGLLKNVQLNKVTKTSELELTKKLEEPKVAYRKNGKLKDFDKKMEKKKMFNENIIDEISIDNYHLLRF